MRKERNDYAQIQRKEAADGVRSGVGHCGAGCGGLSEDDPRPDAQHGLPLCDPGDHRPRGQPRNCGGRHHQAPGAVHGHPVPLENGFPKASMREIAQEAQVGLSNIYNYFKSKDDIFCTVVRPVISAFERMLHEHHGRYGADIMEMYSTESLCKNLRRYIELLVLRIFMERN